MIKSLWGKLVQGGSREAPVPDDERVYVVGDIHGRSDLLRKMHELIRSDLRQAPVKSTAEIYIGDYIDRGPDARGVIEVLSSSPPICGQRICLMGNHEQIFLDFLADPLTISSWMQLGGLETLLSYGLRLRLSFRPEEAKEVHASLRERLPPKHEQFIRQLRLSYSWGPYFFVHAGVRPGISLSEQRSEDLLWIREPFLSSSRNFGAVVVHGHTPEEAPVELPNRIGIDTGAYITGTLTCLVLEGKKRRFLSASLQGIAAA